MFDYSENYNYLPVKNKRKNEIFSTFWIREIFSISEIYCNKKNCINCSPYKNHVLNRFLHIYNFLVSDTKYFALNSAMQSLTTADCFLSSAKISNFT